jgi:hypothetical protein
MNNEFPTHSIAAAAITGSAVPVTLQVSFDLFPQELKLRMRIGNQGEVAIYIFNRLWDLDRSNKLVPDPEKIYRFVRDDNLRLLFGIAPLPRLKTPFYRNVPYVTRVQPRDSFEAEVAIPIPVKEHNVYFSEQKNSSYQAGKVSNVELLVHYIEALPNVETRPIPFDGTALQIVTPAAWDTVKTLRSGFLPVSVQVLRRTDEFERLMLP